MQEKVNRIIICIRVTAEKKLDDQKRMNEKKAISKKRIEELDEKIRNTDKELTELHKRVQRVNEEKKMNCMEKNPKILVSHMNKAKNKKKEILSFKVRKEYENNSKKICTVLIDQQKSTFNKRNKENIENEIFDQIDKNAGTLIEVTENDITIAIDELKKKNHHPNQIEFQPSS